MGDLSDLGSKGLLSFGTRTDGTAELGIAAVADTGVDTANTMVLILAHVRHIVFFNFHIVVVEELLRNEGALLVRLTEVRRRLVNVEAHVVAVAHGVDEAFADDFTDILHGALAEGCSQGGRAQLDKVALVLDEGGNAALLVPDEQVLLGLLGSLKKLHECLETFRLPA